MRPATREDTSILLEFATETEGEAVRTNYPPHELPNGPTWAAITFQYYLTRNPDVLSKTASCTVIQLIGCPVSLLTMSVRAVLYS